MLSCIAMSIAVHGGLLVLDIAQLLCLLTMLCSAAAHSLNCATEDCKGEGKTVCHRTVETSGCFVCHGRY